jgi:hypothetical protein
MRRTIAIVLSLAASLAVVGASNAPAGAKLLDHQAGRIDVTIPDDNICRIDVSTHIVGANPVQLKAIGGYLLAMNTGRLTITWTVPDGRWVQYSFSGPAKDLSVTPQGGDIIVVRAILAGITLSLLASNGDSIRGVGRVVTDFTVDDGGTPLNPDDDKLLDVELVNKSGANNPDIDFCGFISDHLG